MSKKASLIVGLILILGLSAFNYHKFYVSIYQIDFVPEKKRVEITARIFMDDLKLALEQEFKTEINLGETAESAQDVLLLQKYISKHLHFFIDGKEKTIFFLSKEIENNVVIIYLKITDVKKINSLKMRNNLLLEVDSGQQNIMQTDIYSKKRNYIFTKDYLVETITF